MQINIYPPEHQGSGMFDGGAIWEQKPIGFSGEGSDLSRVGPLFYWAWMHAKGPGHIAPHPHQAFEIVTYLIQGSGRHVDSMGNDLTLEAGGIQVMQAGSGLTHEEYAGESGLEGFQIWLEPNLFNTIQDEPQYQSYAKEELGSRAGQPGMDTVVILGPDSPVTGMQTDAEIQDLTFTESRSLEVTLRSGRALNLLAIRGAVNIQQAGETHSLGHKDYGVLRSDMDETLILQGVPGTRLILIEVPLNPGYRLYPKPS